MNEVIAAILKDVPSHLRRHALREVLQAHALFRVGVSRFASNLVFLGGTALRILYDLPRYSEDLDFDLRDSMAEKVDFPILAEEIAAYFQRRGVSCAAKVSIRKPVWKARLVFPGLPFRFSLSPHRTEALSIKFEVDSRPNRLSRMETSVINRYGLIFPILRRDLPSLMAGKICAALKRPHVLARDFFDLGWFLSRKTEPNYEYLASETGIGAPGEMVRRLQERIEAVDLKKLAAALEPFLVQPEAALLISHLNDLLRDYAANIASADGKET